MLRDLWLPSLGSIFPQSSLIKVPFPSLESAAHRDAQFDPLVKWKNDTTTHGSAIGGDRPV